uniref:EGF-like domain-containing protein n=1 Tax=Haemonchus contortus TaxID=6289 RepID=A0A7I4Z3L1_HAECO|nr:Protein C37C3.7 [Haemonchus contortus]
MRANSLPSASRLSNILLPLLTTITTFTRTLCCGVACERFHCSSDMFPPRIVDPYLRRSATFNSPCSCLPDWNSMFCNHTQTVATAPGHILPVMPTICICRKFDDNGSKCHQFITRCFNRKNKKCTCCFNQPSDYCDHLTCRNGEPEFSSSNTSCICHHNPADYPYHICKSLYARNSPAQIEAAHARQNPQPTDERRQDHFSFLGIRIPSSLATYIVVGLLVAVISLTAVILVVGNRKRQKRRDDNLRQRQNAHEALLMQRADDDRYLPSV